MAALSIPHVHLSAVVLHGSDPLKFQTCDVTIESDGAMASCTASSRTPEEGEPLA